MVPKEDYSKYAFYNARRYRPYFDVDTKVCGTWPCSSQDRTSNGLRDSSRHCSHVKAMGMGKQWKQLKFGLFHMQDVLWRVGNSLIGLFRANFIEVTMKSPDL